VTGGRPGDGRFRWWCGCECGSDSLGGEALGEVGEVVQGPAVAEADPFKSFRGTGDVAVGGSGEAKAAHVVEPGKRMGGIGFEVPDLAEIGSGGDRKPPSIRVPRERPGSVADFEHSQCFS
jgi:hypothetical protein